jgi:hypothetical protein
MDVDAVKKPLTRKNARQQVFQALCTDPETGLPIDPRVIFRRLDTDGGGTVDIDEFRTGLEVCGCELTDEELALVWEEIDGADGESDGQVTSHCAPPRARVLEKHQDEGLCVCVFSRQSVGQLSYNCAGGP